MRWFSAPKLAGLPGLPTTRRGVHHRAKAEGWQYRTATTQGGATYEYCSSDLPMTT